MREAIFLITLTKSAIFFAIYSILGKEYLGINESSTFIIFNILFIALSFIFILGETFIKKVAPLRKINIFFYLLPVLTSFIYLVESPTSENSNRYFIIYLAFSFPAIFIGTYVAANKLMTTMVKWLDVLSIILTLGLIASLPKTIYLNQVNIGGASYQTISYISSFAYSICLFSVFFGDQYPRFHFFRSSIYSIITYFLIIIQVISLFISGGRGGFVVVLLVSIILIYFKFKQRMNFGKVIFGTIVIIFSVFLLSDFLPKEVNTILVKGANRIFSYITTSGIDMSETSGRDIVYSKMWKLIKERPVLGYGIFKYVDTSKVYPHNIFMEILLQGGLIFLLFWLITLFSLFNRIGRIIKIDKTNLFLIPFGVYPFTELLFSGSYLMSALFWFVIAYIFNYKLQKLSVNQRIT